MIAKRIGFCYAKTYQTIADYFEGIRDYRRADKIYRDGLAYLAKSGKYEKESKNLDVQYNLFAKRVS